MTGREIRGIDFDDLFASIDAMDTERFLSFLTADASFRFGSAPEVKGAADVGAAVSGFFESIAGLSHRLERIFADGDAVFCEGEVTYTRHDGTSVTLPFADTFDLRKGRISKYRIYMDIVPLYAA